MFENDVFVSKLNIIKIKGTNKKVKIPVNKDKYSSKGIKKAKYTITDKVKNRHKLQKNLCLVRDKNDNIKLINKSDFNPNEYVGINKGKIIVYDKILNKNTFIKPEDYNELLHTKAKFKRSYIYIFDDKNNLILECFVYKLKNILKEKGFINTRYLLSCANGKFVQRGIYKGWHVKKEYRYE